jgi:HEAT repeat protein
MRLLRFVPWGCCCLIAFVLCANARAQEEGANELVQLVVSLLHDSDKDLRSVALEQVRTEAPGEAATKLFAAELPKLSPDVQVLLLSALAARGDAAARPDVLSTLDAAKEPAVKVAAIEAIGALGNAENVALLAKHVGDEEKTVATAARGSLVRLPGEDVPAAIVWQLKTSLPPAQVALIEILAERRALGTIPDLLTATLGDEKTVRAAAMSALGQIASAEHVKDMLPGILKAEPGPERESAEKAVMFVCQRTEDPEQRAAAIVAAYAALPASDQAILLSVLGRVGGTSALAIVEQAIASKDSALHTTGLKALCNWPDASVAPRFIELVKTDEHPEHRTAALRALIRVAPLADARTDAERLALLQEALTLCDRDEERKLVLQRARAIRTPETLRFVAPYMDQPAFAEMACETVVELAHHRTLRDSAKDEFHAALDKVIATSKDATLIERSDRYKKNQTWVRPKK